MLPPMQHFCWQTGAEGARAAAGGRCWAFRTVSALIVAAGMSVRTEEAATLSLSRFSELDRLCRSVSGIRQHGWHHDDDVRCWAQPDRPLARVSIVPKTKLAIRPIGVAAATEMARARFPSRACRSVFVVPTRIRPVTVWSRSFESFICSKGDERWAQAGPMNFAKMRCGSR